MKIGIVSPGNLRLSPFVFFYSDLFAENKIDFDIILPDRKMWNETIEGAEVINLYWNNGRKPLLNYYSFAKETVGIIKKRKYDFLIVLTAQVAVFMSFFLSAKYKGRYIVDIRDYSHEDNCLYYYLEKKSICSAAAVVLSSDKFRSFLPKEGIKYLNCHNISVNKTYGLRKWRSVCKRRIIIGYVGMIGYIAQCESLIRLVKEDERFEFHFYGNENGNELQSIIKDAGCSRICFHGPFLPVEKAEIIESVDILFNSYGNDSKLLRFALSNKLYDSMYYGKLILTSPDTYMDELAGPAAYPIDFNTTKSLDELYCWVMSRDEGIINEYQSRVFKQFEDCNLRTKEEILRMLLSR